MHIRSVVLVFVAFMSLASVTSAAPTQVPWQAIGLLDESKPVVAVRPGYALTVGFLGFGGSVTFPSGSIGVSTGGDELAGPARCMHTLKLTVLRMDTPARALAPMAQRVPPPGTAVMLVERKTIWDRIVMDHRWVWRTRNVRLGSVVNETFGPELIVGTMRDNISGDGELLFYKGR